MRYRILVIVLTSGLVGGLALGIASYHRRLHEGPPGREAFEGRVADVCVQAASRVLRDGERR